MEIGENCKGFVASPKRKFLSLAIFGFAQGETSGWFGDLTAWDNALIGGALFGFLGLFFGAIAGLASGTDAKIHIEGKSDKKIQKALHYLRKKARIRDYK